MKMDRFGGSQEMGIAGSMDAPPSPRCATCDTVLMHEGAICWICHDTEHYELPTPRTSPPLPRPLDDPFEGADGRFWRASDIGRRRAALFDDDAFAV